MAHRTALTIHRNGPPLGPAGREVHKVTLRPAPTSVRKLHPRSKETHRETVQLSDPRVSQHHPPPFKQQERGRETRKRPMVTHPIKRAHHHDAPMFQAQQAITLPLLDPRIDHQDHKREGQQFGEIHRV